jgi:hypothetical protein
VVGLQYLNNLQQKFEFFNMHNGAQKGYKKLFVNTMWENDFQGPSL